MPTRSFQNVARVIAHANGGFTQVLLEDVEYDHCPVTREIPTDIIPRALRTIGSRFQLSGEYPDPHAAPDEIRKILAAWSVTALRNPER
jgi:hypothetical protein